MTGSPFDIKDPPSLHGLQMKKRFGMPSSPTDLIPVLKAEPDLIPDDDTRSLILELLEGKLGTIAARA